MYQYLPCDRDTVKHTGTVPLVLHTDRCTSTYPVDRNTQVQYLKHTGTVPLVRHSYTQTSGATHRQMYQYLPCDRDTVKHTGTVPLVLHTDRCTSTYPVIETAVKHTGTVPLVLTHRQMYQYLPCDRDTVKHTGTVPLVLHTDRCTSTYPVIETQSNTQVQYLWCYTQTDVPVPTL